MTMKRVLITLLGLTIISTCTLPANASFMSESRAKIQHAKIEKNNYKDIESLFKRQDAFLTKYDIEGIKKLYGDNFINNDGYNKEVYFSLVKETWETYPDITYTTLIKNIRLSGNYATVETYETAVATTSTDEEVIDTVGELYSTSNCIYHLEKISGHWLITGEDVLDEYSTLKYGDARFVKMDFSSPEMVSAGNSYTAKLTVDLPADRIVIASINQEKIVNPATKPEEKYRRLPEEQVLERIFTANTDNLNEYNVASIGITQTEPVSAENVRVYMNGLAFIMRRVNVVPKNNFAKVGEK